MTFGNPGRGTSPPRMAVLEALFRKYPGVPKEAIIKADMLLQGVGFSETALEAAQGSKLKSYQIFSFDRVPVKLMLRRESLRVPESVRFKGGLYGLRPTNLITRISLESPYVVDVVDGKLTLLIDEKPAASVEYPGRPKYYDLVFEDGTNYRELFPLVNWNYTAFCTVLRNCQYFADNQGCKFCDINPNVRQQKEIGFAYTVHKHPHQVAEVARAIFSDPEYRAPDAHWMVISGGTVTKGVQGMDDTQFYLNYVEAIRDKVGGRPGIVLQTAAKDKADCKRMRDAGVNVHHPNYEVWDRHLFPLICPGKEKFVGYDEWIRRVVESVDVFGEGNVTPGLVIGVELVQPHGFKSMDEGVRSNAEGFDFMMRHGVTPRPIVWCVEPLSEWGREPPPLLEYVIRVNQAWYETWLKYELPPVPGLGLMGPGRATSDNYIYMDMGY